MISKKSLKVIEDIYNYIDNEWVTMEGDWDKKNKPSTDFRKGFKKAFEDTKRANRSNFYKIKYLLIGLDKELKND